MFKADFKLSEQKTIKADFEIKSTGGTSDHNKLSNRDLPDQHPISAITGLQNTLSGLESSIDTETEQRENEDTILKAQIDANADAILKTREDLQSDIDNNMAEISSLQAETTTIKNDLDDLGDEVSTIESKIPQNATSSNQLVPKSYVDNLEQDIRSDFVSADTSLQTQINGQATAITNAQNKITAIESKIPASASSTNQLTDENFVNSSIATNTAYFIGTFDSIEDLNNYSGTLTRNDYAFVISQDENGNTVYNRYKYNGSAWIFEYALNNSSFTAQQWASINSGITEEDVEKINNIPTKTSELENDSNYLANLTTATSSLSICGAATTTDRATNIGYSSKATNTDTTAVGFNSQATGMTSAAIGAYTKATARCAVQIGAYGTNSEANSVYMSTSDSNNWKLLGNDGKIPNERINIDTTATSGSTNAISSGAVYSLIGDLETVLHTINSGV